MLNFSILLSLYYKESSQNLDSCFQSIWTQQTIKPNEIILVVDGQVGSDLTKIINDWQYKLGEVLKIIQLETNVGLGRALNEGLKYCTNDWVFRMDTDDIALPDRFEKQIDFIIKNPSVVLLGGQIIEFEFSVDEPSSNRLVPVGHHEIVKFSRFRCPFNHMTVAFRKEIVVKEGAYQHHLFMEDYNLWLRLIAAGHSVANLNDVLVFARVGNGMHARRKGLEYIKSEKQLLDLKKQLKIQNSLMANLLFLFRASLRLLPTSLLKGFYNQFLRKKV